MSVHENIIQFEDALKKANSLRGSRDGETQKNLLIGNGFSMEYDTSIFSYGALYEKANLTEELKSLFLTFDTKDFEAILKRLVESHFVIRTYENSSTLISDLIKKDIEIVKDSLIKAIQKSHPESSIKLQENEYEACKKFLRNFIGGSKQNNNHIFSMNYDLLVYWVLNKWMEEENKESYDFYFRDSFSHKVNKNGLDFCEWIDSTSTQNLHYLHGALHIFENPDGSIIKYKYRDNKIPLIDQISESLESQIYPLFVSGDSAKSKLTRIKDSPYLRKCLRRLREMSGSLFVFGHSMHDNDKHIYEAMLEAKKLQHIFIGVRSEEGKQKLINKVTEFVEKHREKHKNTRMEAWFYNTQSANPWGRN